MGGTVLRTALPAQAPPQDSWPNPAMALYQQELERQQAQGAPQPTFTPEQIEQRRQANEREYQLGLLGMLSGNEGLGAAGGAVLKNALAMRQPKITEHGTADQITGEYRLNPEYVEQRNQNKLQQLGQLAAQMEMTHGENASRQQTQRDIAADRFSTQALLRSMAGGAGAGLGIGMTPTPLVDNANNPVFKNKQGLLVKYDADTGQLVQHQGPVVTKPGAGNKTPAEIARMGIAFDALDKTLNDYVSSLDTFNPRDPRDYMDSGKLAKLSSIQSRIVVEAKEAASLGALSGPDLALVHGMLSSPASKEGVAYGKEGLKQQVQQMRNWIQARRDATAIQFPGARPPGAPGAAAPAADVGGGNVVDFNNLPGR